MALRGRSQRAPLTTMQVAAGSMQQITMASDPELFRVAVELCPDAILIHTDGRITYANKAAAALLGAATPESLLQHLVFEFIDPASRGLAQERTAALRAGQAVPPVQMRWLRVDQSVVEVEASAWGANTPDGFAVHVFLRDIRERKFNERKIERLSNLYRALGRTAQAAAAARSSRELFEEVCRTAVEYGRLQTSWIALIDTRKKCLVSAACSGPGQAYCNNVRIQVDPQRPDPQGLFGRALESGEPLICNDLERETLSRPWPDLESALEFRAVAIFPLRQGDQIVGAITHYAEEIDFFDVELTDLLGRMAREVNHALERLSAEQQQRETEAALLAQQRSVSVLMANLPGMVYRCRDDEKWTFEFVSQGCADLTGYSVEELLDCTALSFDAITHPADRDFVDVEVRKALDAHTRYTLEYRVVMRDGHVKWVWDNGIGIHDEDGRRVGVEGFVTDVTPVRRYREQLAHHAHYDNLTGLANRTLVFDRIAEAMSQAKLHQRLAALLFIDIDQFKLINDSLGHSAGDELLKVAADRLASCVRDGDTVARLGGDEFVLLLVDQASESSVRASAERVLKTMAVPYRIQGNEFIATCSVGVVLYPNDGDDPETLIKNAEAAMYRAKSGGRDAYHMFTPEINAQLSERITLEGELRRALQNEEFVLHYQPKVALPNGRLMGAEVLVRWNHPQRGLLMPGRFIGIAEETGLIAPLGDWILRESARQAVRWRRAGIDLQILSVNLSARQFRQNDLIENVRAALNETGLDPGCLDLELTESLMMENTETYIKRLHALKNLGVQLSVDDFGTGYSSLSYLKRFPVDRLKIDKSFVRDIVTDPGDAAIAQAIIRLGQILGLIVTAEGVETDEQLAFLRRHHCDEAQGYYFSPPLDAAAFEGLWRRGLLAPPAWTQSPALPAVV